MTKINQEQIDNYHSGLMSEAEMANFEKQLESDPALKAESDLQADIVNGLKEFRKTELKARMDAINVGPTWMEFIGQSALMKSMGGVIVASVIGTGIYFLGERDIESETDRPVTVNAPVAESIEYVWKLGDEEKDNTANTELEKPKLVKNPKVADKQILPLESEKMEESKDNQAENIEKAETFKPSFEAPTVADVDGDAKFKSADLDELPETTSTGEADEPIDVETENSRGNTMKYKYYDGKLFLSGDFDKAPYEILEINSASGRRIYVFYLNTYYQVGTTDKLTELPEVKDQEVIKELKLLRENK